LDVPITPEHVTLRSEKRAEASTDPFAVLRQERKEGLRTAKEKEGFSVLRALLDLPELPPRK
jgi:hypothetical protein